MHHYFAIMLLFWRLKNDKLKLLMLCWASIFIAHYAASIKCRYYSNWFEVHFCDWCTVDRSTIAQSYSKNLQNSGICEKRYNHFFFENFPYQRLAKINIFFMKFHRLTCSGSVEKKSQKPLNLIFEGKMHNFLYTHFVLHFFTILL